MGRGADEILFGDSGAIQRPAEEAAPAPPRIRVEAEVHSDDYAVSATFDAGPYLEQASVTDLEALLDCGWGGDYAADDAFWWAVGLPDASAQLRVVRDYIDASGNGFEVSIDSSAAENLLIQVRPAIADKLGLA